VIAEGRRETPIVSGKVVENQAVVPYMTVNNCCSGMAEAEVGRRNVVEVYVTVNFSLL
jgi:hypothetical protein